MRIYYIFLRWFLMDGSWHGMYRNGWKAWFAMECTNFWNLSFDFKTRKFLLIHDCFIANVMRIVWVVQEQLYDKKIQTEFFWVYTIMGLYKIDHQSELVPRLECSQLLILQICIASFWNRELSAAVIANVSPELLCEFASSTLYNGLCNWATTLLISNNVTHQLKIDIFRTCQIVWHPHL